MIASKVVALDKTICHLLSRMYHNAISPYDKANLKTAFIMAKKMNKRLVEYANNNISNPDDNHQRWEKELESLKSRL